LASTGVVTTTGDRSDELARSLARWLAPYIAEELNLGDAPARPTRYDAETCREYAAGLGTTVLPRAQAMFQLLAEHGRVGSLELATAIGVSSPRALSGVLTTALKRRAVALSLEPPWHATVDADDRTVWIDHNGIAGLMTAAFGDEIAARGV
jgi:hypothetical protein